jgi:hypothetical protein
VKNKIKRSVLKVSGYNSRWYFPAFIVSLILMGLMLYERVSLCPYLKEAIYSSSPNHVINNLN